MKVIKGIYECTNSRCKYRGDCTHEVSDELSYNEMLERKCSRYTPKWNIKYGEYGSNYKDVKMVLGFSEEYFKEGKSYYILKKDSSIWNGTYLLKEYHLDYLIFVNCDGEKINVDIHKYTNDKVKINKCEVMEEIR